MSLSDSVLYYYSFLTPFSSVRGNVAAILNIHWSGLRYFSIAVLTCSGDREQFFLISSAQPNLPLIGHLGCKPGGELLTILARHSEKYCLLLGDPWPDIPINPINPPVKLEGIAPIKETPVVFKDNPVPGPPGVRSK